MNKQRNTTETFSTGTNNFPVNHKIFQTVLGAAQITCVAVVLMFVVSACGSSDELSESPAVEEVEPTLTASLLELKLLPYSTLDRTPPTTIYDPWGDRNDPWGDILGPDLYEQPVYGFMQDMQERFYPERLPFPDWVERRHQAVEAWELKLPELARHAKSHPGLIDVERIVPLIERHKELNAGADDDLFIPWPRFEDAKQGNDFLSLLRILDTPLDQVRALLDEAMVEWRLVEHNCQILPMTMDLLPGRADLTVINDLVSGWWLPGGKANGVTRCAIWDGDTDPRYGILGLELSEAAAILANIEEVSSWRLVHENCSYELIPMTNDLRQGRVNLTTTDDVVVHYSIEHIDKPDDDLSSVYKLNPQPTCEVELGSFEDWLDARK